MKSIKRVVSTILALLCVFGVNMYSSDSFIMVDTMQVSADNTSKANELLSLVNQYRQQNGLNPFKTCSVMNTMANVRATEITDGVYLNRSDGSYYSSIFTQYGITTTVFNQNTYWGGNGYNTPSQAFEEFKLNDRQNKNMLSTSYEYIGIGVYEKDGKTYYYQLFCTSKNLKEDSPSVTTTATTTTEPIVTTTIDTQSTTTVTETDVSLSKDELLKKYNLDVDKNGNVNTIDLLILKKYLMGNLYN